MTTLRRMALLAASVAAFWLLPAPAPAADLVIGRASEQSSLDPLFSRTGNNYSTSEAMFDRLVLGDANNQLQPALAVSWRNIDPLNWEIRLRPNVKFHDGSDFTAEDVVFSMERAKSLAASPASFAGALVGIAEMRAADRLTLRIRTSRPLPGLIEQIGRVFIVSAKAATGLSTADFNAGKGMVGTGPYRFVEYLHGQRVVLKRNPAYWGPKPDFENVTLRFITKEAARVAALLAGDVDLIDQVPPNQLKSLAAGGKVQLHSIASTRLIYLALDPDRDQSPFVTDVSGRKLEKNPLKDPRVRRAISLMIDRRLIVDRLLEGAGEAAGQMVPRGLGGHDPSLAPPAPDVAAAKKLLAEAGYPGGFGITIHTSSDRFAKDGDLGQALGQMLVRGGLKVNAVQAVPYNVYASAATKREYSAFVFSFGTTTPDSGIALTNVLASYDKEAGTGVFNRSRYANAEFDAALRRALAEFDEAKRNDGLREAARIVFADHGIVPLYWPVAYWAAKKGVAYEARRDESTLPQKARLAP
jgi:peptide/nickel transport system substrate-binding protein